MTLNVGPLRYSKPCTLSFFFPEKMLFFKTASVLGTYLQISQWSTGSVTCRETILFCYTRKSDTFLCI